MINLWKRAWSSRFPRLVLQAFIVVALFHLVTYLVFVFLGADTVLNSMGVLDAELTSANAFIFDNASFFIAVKVLVLAAILVWPDRFVRVLRKKPVQGKRRWVVRASVVLLVIMAEVISYAGGYHV